MRSASRVLELVVATLLGRLLIAGATGESFGTAFVPLVDWRWLFALPAAALLALMVELAVDPHFLD